MSFSRCLIQTLSLISLVSLSACLPSPLKRATGTYSQLTTNFGANPTNVTVYTYVPAKLAASPPLMVHPHACHGSAQSAYTGDPYPSLADQYGFIILYPDSPNTVDKCWDVSSRQTLTHNGGGDSLGIVSATKYVMQKYAVDTKRVFATGTSSGAMMTNVLLGSYPDLFAAGSVWAGVAFGCFAGDGYDVWNGDCATGQVIKSGAKWKAIVQAAYPGYNGWRPKMQVFHGTVDQVLYPQNLQEEIKEWTAVLNLSSTATSMTQNTPLPGWTKSVYGSQGRFEATSAANVTHDIQTQVNSVMKFFDLTCTGSGCFRYGG